MRTHDGILEFEYRSELKRIKFSIDISPGYGGLPLAHIVDKHNRYHPFIRGRNTVWYSLVNNPKLPSDFLTKVFLSLEEEYRRILLNYQHTYSFPQ